MNPKISDPFCSGKIKEKISFTDNLSDGTKYVGYLRYKEFQNLCQSKKLKMITCSRKREPNSKGFLFLWFQTHAN